MSKNYALQAAKRDHAGKGAARSLRRENRVPAVIYGDKKEPVTISLDDNTINVEYRRGHMFTTLCDMDIDGQHHQVLARDVQVHPVTDHVIHVDFLRVTEKTKIAVEVPVHFINEDKSPGIHAKAVLNIVRHEVELLCSAMNLPEQLEVNLEGKEIGDPVKISDAILPEGTSPVITGRDFTIATLVAPKSAAEIEAEEAAADAAEAEADAAAAEEAKEKAEADKEAAAADKEGREGGKKE